MQILQLQTDSNKDERCAIGQTISQRIEDHPGLLDFIFFNEEANFHLTSNVDKQNMRCGTQAQPHDQRFSTFSLNGVKSRFTTLVESRTKDILT